jgi:hypothetical protein
MSSVSPLNQGLLDSSGLLLHPFVYGTLKFQVQIVKNELHQKVLISATRNVLYVQLHLYCDTRLDKITICTERYCYLQIFLRKSGNYNTDSSFHCCHFAFIIRLIYIYIYRQKKDGKYSLAFYTGCPKSRDSVVGIATGYGLDDQGVGVGVPLEARIFTSPCRPDRLWGPPSLPPNGYRG